MKPLLATLLITAALMVPVLHAAGDKPNIVVMLVDDMGIMDTSLPFLTEL